MDDLQYGIQTLRMGLDVSVLNLVINGWPSIPKWKRNFLLNLLVLNLVINGWPSIPKIMGVEILPFTCFKPCYKWMTFNTKES